MSRSRKNRREQKRILSSIETNSPLLATYLFDDATKSWGAMITYQNDIVEFLLEDSLDDLLKEVKTFLQDEYPKTAIKSAIDRKNTGFDKQTELAVFLQVNHL